jgi:hypothetical protein
VWGNVLPHIGPECGSRTFLPDFGIHLQDYMLSQVVRPHSLEKYCVTLPVINSSSQDNRFSP